MLGDRESERERALSQNDAQDSRRMHYHVNVLKQGERKLGMIECTVCTSNIEERLWMEYLCCRHLFIWGKCNHVI